MRGRVRGSITSAASILLVTTLHSRFVLGASSRCTFLFCVGCFVVGVPGLGSRGRRAKRNYGGRDRSAVENGRATANCLPVAHLLSLSSFQVYLLRRIDIIWTCGRLMDGPEGVWGWECEWRKGSFETAAS